MNLTPKTKIATNEETTQKMRLDRLQILEAKLNKHHHSSPEYDKIMDEIIQLHEG